MLIVSQNALEAAIDNAGLKGIRNLEGFYGYLDELLTWIPTQRDVVPKLLEFYCIVNQAPEDQLNSSEQSADASDPHRTGTASSSDHAISVWGNDMTAKAYIAVSILAALSSATLAEPIDLYCAGHGKSFPEAGDPPGIEGLDQIRVTINSARTEARVYSSWAGEDRFAIKQDDLNFSIKTSNQPGLPNRLFTLNRHSLNVQYYLGRDNENKPRYSLDGACTLYEPKI